MTVPSWLCPIYSLDIMVSSGKCERGVMCTRACKRHELDEPHGNIFQLGHLYEVGGFGVVEVLDDDSIQFDRLEV